MDKFDGVVSQILFMQALGFLIAANASVRMSVMIYFVFNNLQNTKSPLLSCGM